MMRGGTIVTTFIFSMIFMKLKAKRSQVVGSAMALIGVLIVGASSLAFADSSSGSDTVTIETFRVCKYLATFYSLPPSSQMVFSSLSKKNCSQSIISNLYKWSVSKEFSDCQFNLFCYSL